MQRGGVLVWTGLLPGELVVTLKEEKIGDIGSYLWYRNYGGSPIQKVLSLPSGDVMLIGTTGKTNGGDLLVTLLDVNGNFKWQMDLEGLEKLVRGLNG